MLLLNLPPEILKCVFDELGPSFFHEDVVRLAVCKQWYAFALSECDKHIALSQDSLGSLAVSGVPERLPLFQGSLETLDLKMRDHRSWNAITRLLQGGNVRVLEPPTPPATIEAYLKVQEDQLVKLATIAKASRRLRNLRIRAEGSPCIEGTANHLDHLQIPTMQAFLSTESLSVLFLDVSSSFSSRSGQLAGDRHVCPAIGAVLGKLRSLQIRMPWICRDVLKPPDPKQRLRLSRVVINLCLNCRVPEAALASHSQRCSSDNVALRHYKQNCGSRQRLSQPRWRLRNV
jgi:hypothetical protein